VGLEFEPQPEAAAAAAVEANTPFTIELVRGHGLPVMDTWYSDPYARVRLISERPGLKAHQTKSVGRERQSMVKNATVNPVWQSYFDFGLSQADVKAEKVTHLVIDVWDEDIVTGSDWMCRAKIPIGELRPEERNFTYSHKHDTKHESEVYDPRHKHDTRGRQRAAWCSSSTRAGYITVRLPPAGPASEKMTLFFIRHGESQWNKAQEGNDFYAMMKRVNHPLSATGVAQCQGFAKQVREQQLLSEEAAAGSSSGGGGQALGEQPHPRYQDFASADMVFASPLTRATQTALITLEGHATLADQGMVLLASAREKKNVGGQDTVGDKTDGSIMETVDAELRAKDGSGLDSAQVDALLTAVKPPGKAAPACWHPAALVPKVDVHDCVSPWWTPGTDVDTDVEMQHRFSSFFSTLRYYSGKIGWRSPAVPGRQKQIIVVGHSHFIRELCKGYMDAELAGKDEVAARLCKEKLDNATCIALDLEFPTLADPVVKDWKAAGQASSYVHNKFLGEQRLTADPKVVGVAPMFGMRFAGSHADDEDSLADSKSEANLKLKEERAKGKSKKGLLGMCCGGPSESGGGASNP
jgi:broad specificity phosphatase PhoE